MSERPIAVVTGGSRGIGRAVAVELARAGYDLVINFQSNEAAAAETLALVRGAGADGRLLPFDVADAAAAEERLGSLVREAAPIEVLVLNAGVTADSLFPMMPAQGWHRVIDVSLNGFFNVTKPLLKTMMRKRKGSIVAISSISAQIPNRGQVNYSAAKAGINAAIRSLSAEVARLGIRVNAVAPGLIETDMTRDVPRDEVKKLIPMNRFGAPEEVARVVRFLCSNDASYITGQVIGVNGGMA